MKANRRGEPNNMLEKEKQMLTVPQIAEYMGVTKKTVINWIDAGKLAAFKLERTFRIKDEDFKAFMSEHMTNE